MKLVPFYELVRMDSSSSSIDTLTSTTFLSASLREKRSSQSTSHPSEGYSSNSSAHSENEDPHSLSSSMHSKARTSKASTVSSTNRTRQLRRSSGIVPRKELRSVLDALKAKGGNSPEFLSERALYMLLLSVLESVSFQSGTTLIEASLRLLQSVTSLFEEVVGLWFQGYDQEAMKQELTNSMEEEEDGKKEKGKSSRSPTPSASSKGDTTPTPPPPILSAVRAYQGTMHIARMTLRLWLQLFSQVLHSSPSPSQLSEIKPLLFSPLATVSKACYNLRQVGVFKGNAFLDHEFTLIILETLFSSLYAVNLYSMVPACSIQDFFEAVRDTLTDGYQEWFTYLCSKLLEVAESHAPSTTASVEDQSRLGGEKGSFSAARSNWPSVLGYSHSLLSYILRELIVISSHIQAGQKAFKLALTSKKGIQIQLSELHSSILYLKPVSYSLEVATGFDKLTQRLSKIAQLLLDMFRTVPLIQLLSLQLLSETESDTVGTIGNFLSIISDPAVRSNSEVFDLYLELLENVWFRLSPDYTGSTLWWNKLSNYSTLLLESGREVTCQVIYHLQCLFSHESTVLKSQVTQHVVIPFHTHLMTLVKSKCYQKITNTSSSSSSSDTTSEVATPGEGEVEDKLSGDEKEIISVFLKLLLKVASNVHSLGTFTAESVNLYRLFLLFPLREFRSASFGVLDECLAALRRMSSSAPPSTCSSPTNSDASSPTGMDAVISLQASDEGMMRKTIIRILLSLAYSVQKIEKIPKQCLAIAEGKAPLPKYGLAEADMVHQLIRTTFESTPLKQLLTPMFVDHLAVVADIWELLGRLAMQDEVVTRILTNNHIWDIVQVLAPSLCSLLSRVQQRLSREKDLDQVEDCVNSLKKHSVSLLSHLITLAHFFCWRKQDSKVSVMSLLLCCIPCLLLSISLYPTHSLSLLSPPPQCIMHLSTQCVFHGFLMIAFFLFFVTSGLGDLLH